MEAGKSTPSGVITNAFYPLFDNWSGIQRGQLWFGSPAITKSDIFIWRRIGLIDPSGKESYAIPTSFIDIRNAVADHWYTNAVRRPAE